MAAAGSMFCCAERLFVNRKRTYRLYREAGLAVCRRKRKRIGLFERKPLPKPSAVNRSWRRVVALFFRLNVWRWRPRGSGAPSSTTACRPEDLPAH
jgi:hypothetical protein